jgi:4-amino-4-deoxy-L-arabinose transferase-like glycosyltransferase
MPNHDLSGSLRTRMDRRMVLALALYFIAAGVIRVLVSDALELDEAEQVLLAQWWQWGYSSQPPLYTWLYTALEALLGPGVVALSLIRETLLFLTYLFVYLIGLRVLRDPRLAVPATLALMLIPQIVWENQREHTHSLLALCLAAATLFVVIELMRRPRLLGYLVLGVLAALGLLAKYNMVVFLAALALALLSLPAGRALIFDRRLIAAILIAGLLLAPHLAWLLQHAEVGVELNNLVDGEPNSARIPLGAVLVTTLTFLTPMWLVFVLLFPRALIDAFGKPLPSPDVALLLRDLIAVMLLLLIMSWALDMDQIKERWMQPLLFAVPLLLFAFVPASDADAVRTRWFSRIAWTVGVIVLLVSALRIPLAPWTGSVSRLHQPIAALAQQIEARGIAGDLVLADHYHLAGVFRMHLPERRFFGPRAGFVVPPVETLANGVDPVLLIWDASRADTPPPDLIALAEAAGFELNQATPQYLEVPYGYGLDRTYRLGLLVVHPTPRGLAP